MRHLVLDPLVEGVEGEFKLLPAARERGQLEARARDLVGVRGGVRVRVRVRVRVQLVWGFMVGVGAGVGVGTGLWNWAEVRVIRVRVGVRVGG